MMNGPFFRNYSKQQQQPWSTSSRSIPVQQTQQKPSPKVISVPVHFVSSDQPPTAISISMLKDSATLKIQKVFRGFVVRKSVRKIVSIRNEVCEIERRIDDTEVVDLIRRDEKERLRVNETLMSLLFKLDSIRGVDCGIRDLRKAVTKKAIGLQEKVDSIAETLGSNSDPPGEIVSDNVCCTTSRSEQVTEASNNSGDEIVVDNNQNSEAVIKDGEVEGMETSPDANRMIEELMDDNEKLKRLMAQISERNEMQTRMINCLSKRVEQLEKVEKQRKKKKTNVPFRGRRRRDVDSFCIY